MNYGHFVAACMLAGGMAAGAQGATVCVPNKLSGKLEPVRGGRLADCPDAAEAARASSVEAVPVSQTTAPAATAGRIWEIHAGDKSVRTVLERWSKEVGYQLLWELPVDLELNAVATLNGSFEEALDAVLLALADSDYPVEAMIYENHAVRIVKRAQKASR